MVRRCERDSLYLVAHQEVLLQELPYICEVSQPKEAKESSADHIDSSRRIGSRFPRIPCQSLYILPADMCARSSKFSPL